MPVAQRGNTTLTGDERRPSSATRWVPCRTDHEARCRIALGLTTVSVPALPEEPAGRQAPGDGGARGASERVTAASACRRVVGKTGTGLSSAAISSSISVQPRITPSAPA